MKALDVWRLPAVNLLFSVLSSPVSGMVLFLSEHVVNSKDIIKRRPKSSDPCKEYKCG